MPAACTCPACLLLATREKPDTDEHGRLKGYRLVLWPGVEADAACCEYMPSPSMVAGIQAQAERNATGRMDS